MSETEQEFRARLKNKTKPHFWRSIGRWYVSVPGIGLAYGYSIREAWECWKTGSNPGSRFDQDIYDKVACELGFQPHMLRK